MVLLRQVKKVQLYCEFVLYVRRVNERTLHLTPNIKLHGPPFPANVW